MSENAPATTIDDVEPDSISSSTGCVTISSGVIAIIAK
jgi:hypothetical protein